MILGTWRIARSEASHFSFSSLAQAAIVAGLVLPVLMLLAVQNGIVQDLRAHLESTPENLRLRPTSAVSQDDAWYVQWSSDPRVGFLAPHTYSNADDVRLVNTGGEMITMALLASGDGDPFLPQGIPVPGPGDAVITNALAERIGAQVGGEIVLQTDCQDSTTPTHSLRVTGIIRPSVWYSRGALVDLDFMRQLYFCRQGYQSDLLGASGDPQPSAISYPRFRMFAARLKDVRPLASALESEGITIRAQFATADLADSIERTTMLVLLALIVVMLGGAVIALLAAFQSDARRMRPHLATLQMEGMSRTETCGVLIFKGLLVSTPGAVIGGLIYFAVVAGLNLLIAQDPLPFETHARLTPAMFTLVCSGTVALAVLAAGLAALNTFPDSPLETQNAN